MVLTKLNYWFKCKLINRKKNKYLCIPNRDKRLPKIPILMPLNGGRSRIFAMLYSFVWNLDMGKLKRHHVSIRRGVGS